MKTLTDISLDFSSVLVQVKCTDDQCRLLLLPNLAEETLGIYPSFSCVFDIVKSQIIAVSSMLFLTGNWEQSHIKPI